MGKKSRDKGANAEREVVNILRKTFPHAIRNLGESGGQRLGIDITAGALRVQVKRWADFAPISRLMEVPIGEGIPALITRGDRQRWVVVMYLDDALDIWDDVVIVHEESNKDVAPF